MIWISPGHSKANWYGR